MLILRKFARAILDAALKGYIARIQGQLLLPATDKIADLEIKCDRQQIEIDKLKNQIENQDAPGLAEVVIEKVVQKLMNRS